MEGWSKLEHEVVPYLRQLSEAAVKMYYVFKRDARGRDSGRLKRAEIAERAGIHWRSVSRGFAKLEESGLMHFRRTGQANEYFFLQPWVKAKANRDVPSEVPHGTSEVPNCAHRKCQIATSHPYREREKEPEKKTSAGSSGRNGPPPKLGPQVQASGFDLPMKERKAMEEALLAAAADDWDACLEYLERLREWQRSKTEDAAEVVAMSRHCDVCARCNRSPLDMCEEGNALWKAAENAKPVHKAKPLMPALSDAGRRALRSIGGYDALGAVKPSILGLVAKQFNEYFLRFSGFYDDPSTRPARVVEAEQLALPDDAMTGQQELPLTEGGRK